MNEATEPIFLIDSNILIYAYDRTDAQKHKIAKELLEKCWKQQAKYAVSTQNLAEFFINITKKVPNPLSIEEAEEIVHDIINHRYWIIFSYTASTLQQAITIQKTYRKPFWDALLAATMKENNIFHVYTENAKDFEGYKNIVVINLFEKGKKE
ncbi:PIN domain-containing protein [Candidatus Woesearchaeota archaeon]|nr:PIN domain-containing protein [Candidatus Woesearchaeota archaeon]